LDDLTDLVQNPFNNNNRELEMHMLLYGGQLNIASGASNIFHEVEFRGGADATYFPVNQTAISLLPVGRTDHSAVNIGMNTMLVFGGTTDSTVLDELWSFDLVSKVWFQRTPTGVVPAARHGHRAVLIDSKMYIFGGKNGNTYYDDVVYYDIVNNAWVQTVLPPVRPSARYGHSMVAYLNRGFYIFGGQDIAQSLSNEVWYYDVVANTWELQVINRTVSLPPTERVDHTAVLARGSRYMIVFGGLDGQYTNDLWIYDVECKTWTQMNPGGNRPTARGRHSAIIYNDNEMYIFGGRDATQPTRTMHRYTVPVAPPYGYCPVKLNVIVNNSASIASYGFMLLAILIALL
jgi:N-acetylneuraminic acid mutarotase